MLETCTLTVLALMNSCLPISRLLRPCATRREDLALARGERLVLTVRGRCVGRGRRPSARQLGQQRLGAEPLARSPAAATSSVGLRPGRPAARSTAASRAWDRASSKTWPNVSNAATAVLPGRISSSSRRGVDAGQPAQPQVLGAQPGRPTPCPRVPIDPCAAQPAARPPRRARPARSPRAAIAARSAGRSVGRARSPAARASARTAGPAPGSTAAPTAARRLSTTSSWAAEGSLEVAAVAEQVDRRGAGEDQRSCRRLSHHGRSVRQQVRGPRRSPRPAATAGPREARAASAGGGGDSPVTSSDPQRVVPVARDVGRRSPPMSRASTP